MEKKQKVELIKNTAHHALKKDDFFDGRFTTKKLENPKLIKEKKKSRKKIRVYDYQQED